MKIFGAFALDEHGVAAPLQDRRDRQEVGLTHVFERGDERAVVVPPALVPGSIQRRQLRADIDLVDGRVELYPGITFGESARVSREELRKIGILEILDEIGHPEVAEVYDRRDVQALDFGEYLIGELPIEA